jgi:serine/threonine-protein kinase
MQPPLSTGTVLQNRYRLAKVLGQGGFGRTYLAEDQGRFNELCALKEFIPTQSGAYALDKSKELFQREAAILYQIQHPQIPQFRATFEESQRLFLVQDYVEGKNYRELLNDRRANRSTFTEAEVQQLMRQLLPVLAHIHSKGIIHRDISPDNIILRQRDQLPVLIDFGVVKEIVTRVQSPETVPQQTTVGKLGYAPSEQMQTGRAYPSSDLYGLAVTCIVLLTGREPQELYDDRTLSWQWRHLANVSPGFAAILDRMLSHRPDDRYQSVSDVAQALQAFSNPAATPPTPTVGPIAPPASAVSPAPATQHTGTSQMPTVAVGRRSDAAPPTNVNPPQRTHAVVPPPAPSVWDNPWSVVAIGIGLALVTGIGSWAVVNALLNTQESPPVSATPTPIAASPTPSPSPSPTEPVEYSQRLNLAPGATTTTDGTLQANETVSYIIAAAQGDTLSAALQGEGVLMTVLAPDGQPADGNAERVTRWQSTLDFTGDYAIQLRPVRGVEQSDYRLEANLQAAPEPTPTPSPSPTPTAEPEIDAQRLTVPVGEQGIQISNNASDRLIRRYLVGLEAGQVLTAELLVGAVSLNVRYPNGQLVEDAESVTFWQAQVPEDGEYIIDVIAADQADFTLGVTIVDPTAPEPAPE